MGKTAASLCNTSVDDARSSLYHINDLQVVKDAVKYEIENYNRVSMVKILKAKIRQLEANMRGDG